MTGYGPLVGPDVGYAQWIATPVSPLAATLIVSSSSAYVYGPGAFGSGTPPSASCAPPSPLSAVCASTVPASSPGETWWSAEASATADVAASPSSWPESSPVFPASVVVLATSPLPASVTALPPSTPEVADAPHAIKAAKATITVRGNLFSPTINRSAPGTSAVRPSPSSFPSHARTTAAARHSIY